MPCDVIVAFRDRESLFLGRIGGNGDAASHFSVDLHRHFNGIAPQISLIGLGPGRISERFVVSEPLP